MPAIALLLTAVLTHSVAVEHSLGGQVDLLWDPSGELAIEDVTRPDVAARFERHDTPYINEGFTSDVLWLRLMLPPPSHPSGSWVLGVGYAPLDYVTFFQPRPDDLGAGGSGFDVIETGGRLPFDTRPIPNRHFLLPFESEGRVPRPHYLRIATESALSVPLTVTTLQQSHLASELEGLIYGALLAVVLMMIAGALLISVVDKDSSYLWYAATLGSLGLTDAVISGYAFQYLWPAAPWWDNVINPCAASLAVFFALGFTNRFLGSARSTPRVARVMGAVSVLAGANAVASFLLPYRFVSPAASALGVFAVASVIGSAMVAARSGFRPARYYLGGWGLLCVGVFFSVLRNAGVAPVPFLAMHGMSLGIASQAVFVGLAVVVGAATRRAETAQVRSESLRNVPLPVLIFDRHLCVRFANTAAAELIGRPPAACPGEPVAAVLPSGQNVIATSLQRAMADRVPCTVDSTIDLPGRSVPVRFSAAPLCLDGGEVMGAVGYVSDVSKIMELSRRAGMTEVAVEMMHNVGNVLNSVATAAGSIRTRVEDLQMDSVERLADLLRKHAGQLDALERQHPGAEHIPELLAALVAGMRHCREEVLSEIGCLTGNIDHINRIIRSQQALSRDPATVELVSLVDIVDSAIRLTNLDAEEPTIQIERQYACRPRLAVDSVAVTQILVNLLRNAVQALRSVCTEGRVTIRVEPTEDDGVAIWVIDNGPGVPPDQRERVFDFGFSTRATGHGVGLHASARAAQAMGGTLRCVEPPSTGGAAFRLEL